MAKLTSGLPLKKFCGALVQVAAHFGVSRALVCYHLALLHKLPGARPTRTAKACLATLNC